MSLKKANLKLILGLLVAFVCRNGLTADEAPFGAKGMAAFDREMRENLLPLICQKSKNGPSPCQSNGLRKLKPNQREMFFSILDSNLKGGIFSEIEHSALQSLDFENELQKTPTGRQLIELINRNRLGFTNKLFYHIERSDDSTEKIGLLHHGFTVSQHGKALIGINANQSATEAFYTLAHEYFHLFDEDLGKTDPMSEILQEVRAVLFELRIYIERKTLLKNDKYTVSEFHQNFLIDNHPDWQKIVYSVYKRTMPENIPGEYAPDRRPGKDFLKITASGEAVLEDLESGEIFHETLLQLFNEKLSAENTSIVARLLFYVPTPESPSESQYSNMRKDVTKRVVFGYAREVEKQYEHFLDHRQKLRLRMTGFNDLIHGGPSPRNLGGP